MLSIAALGVGQERYYLDAVVEGVDEYYTENGETAGRWAGAGTSGLGLAGRVEAGDLAAVLAGTDPRSGVQFGKSGRSVPGFDLTFSPPKSVSLL